MKYTRGSVIIDRPTRAVAVIRHVQRVPKCGDLFGVTLPSHRRYVIAYSDGRYAVREGEGDFDDLGDDAAA